MTNLELCQALRGDCSIQGEGPTSVIGQTGIYAKLVRWVKEAYVEIQALPHDYDWMRAEMALPLLAGTGTYDLLSGASWNRPDVRRFMSNNSWLVSPSGVRSRVLVIDHAKMLRDWPLTTTVGTPSVVTIRPNRTVTFNFVPSTSFTWNVEAKLTPESLSAGDHVPSMPEQHHDAIVFKAKMKYATHDGDMELWKAARSEFNGAMSRLIIETVPAIEWTVSRGED